MQGFSTVIDPDLTQVCDWSRWPPQPITGLTITKGANSTSQELNYANPYHHLPYISKENLPVLTIFT